MTKYIKKMISIILAFIIFSSSSLAYINVAKAEDTTNFIPISNVSDLISIKNNPNGKFFLTQDINLEWIEWTPIPNFSGILDGNNYSLKNLKITATNAGSSSGLFSEINSVDDLRRVFEEAIRNR